MLSNISTAKRAFIAWWNRQKKLPGTPRSTKMKGIVSNIDFSVKWGVRAHFLNVAKYWDHVANIKKLIDVRQQIRPTKSSIAFPNLIEEKLGKEKRCILASSVNPSYQLSARFIKSLWRSVLHRFSLPKHTSSWWKCRILTKITTRKLRSRGRKRASARQLLLQLLSYVLSF